MLALSLRGAERRSNLDLGAHCPTRLLRGVYPRAAQSADPWARNDSHSIGFDQPDLVLLAAPFSGHLLVFRGKRSDYLKLLYWDGSGCAYSPSARRRAGLSGRYRRLAQALTGPTLWTKVEQLRYISRGKDMASV